MIEFILATCLITGEPPAGWIEQEIAAKSNSSLPYTNESPLEGDIKICTKGYCKVKDYKEVDDENTREIFCGL